MGDYLPQADDAFDAWCRGFLEKARENMTRLKLTGEELAELERAHAAWSDCWRRLDEARHQADVLVAAKKQARRACERAFRRQAGRTKYAPGVNDEIRAALGLTPVDRARQPPPDVESLPAPETEVRRVNGPVVELRFRQQDGGRGKPDGVRGVFVDLTQAGPDAEDKDWVFAGISTRMTYRCDLGDGASGRYWFRARWCDRLMRRGPCGPVAEAEVPG